MEKNRNRTNNSSVCVLVSGGLDSSVLLAEMVKEYRNVYPVYIRSSLLWEDTEIYWLKKFLSAIKSDKVKELKIINTSVGDIYDGHWSITGDDVPDKNTEDEAVYLPGRNIILLSKTAVFCGINKIPVIALADLKGNPFSDSSRRFFDLIQQSFSEGLDFPVSIITPFSELTKSEVISLSADIPIELTFSCIHPVGKKHCGVCNKCQERKEAFIKIGAEDRTNYVCT